MVLTLSVCIYFSENEKVMKSMINGDDDGLQVQYIRSAVSREGVHCVSCIRTAWCDRKENVSVQFSSNVGAPVLPRHRSTYL